MKFQHRKLGIPDRLPTSKSLYWLALSELENSHRMQGREKLRPGSLGEFLTSWENSLWSKDLLLLWQLDHYTRGKTG
jgi:hypothetical protein